MDFGALLQTMHTLRSIIMHLRAYQVRFCGGSQLIRGIARATTHIRAVFQTIYNWFCSDPKPAGKPVPPPPPPVPRERRRSPSAVQSSVPTPRVQERPQKIPPAPQWQGVQVKLTDGAHAVIQGAGGQNNGSNESYQLLRNRAREEGEQMSRCFAESHDAFARGEHTLAKELFEHAREHMQTMKRLNGEASEWIFRENNKDTARGRVDLHGLFVKEAIPRAEQAVKKALQRGDAKIRFIVGKGRHNPDGTTKLKPAIKELMQKQGYIAELDESNSGVLVVTLNGRQTGVGRVI